MEDGKGEKVGKRRRDREGKWGGEWWGGNKGEGRESYPKGESMRAIQVASHV